MRKRILAFVFVLSMIFSLQLPVTTYAAIEEDLQLMDETGYAIADEAYSETGYYIATYDAVPDNDEINADTAPSVPYTDDESVIYERMIAMQKDYPEGKRWTNADEYTWSYILRPEGSKNPYSAYIGHGCVAFSMILSDAAFGNIPAYQKSDVIYDELRAGDILRINNNLHSVIILKKYDDGVVIAEGNFNSSVHWGRTLTREKVEASDYYITRYTKSYKCRFETNGGSDIPDVSVVESELIPEPETPVKNRYQFNGWYKDPELKKAWNFKKDTIESDMTLYAGWKVDESQLLKEVVLDKASVMLPLDSTAVINAELKPAGNPASISWKSDSDCIKINPSADGSSLEITPLSRGTANVTVTAVDKVDSYEVTKTAVAKVFVKRSGAGLKATLIAGEQVDVSKAFLDDECPFSDFKYTVSPTGFASVNNKGVLAAKKAGEVTVTALDRYNGEVYDTIILTILEKPVIKFDKPLTYTGQTISVFDAITNKPGGTDYKFVDFLSTKESVASVDSEGKITAISSGNANIKAVISEKGKNGSVKAYYVSAKLTVKVPQFAKTSYSIQTGQKLVVSMKNVNASTGAEFSSSDPDRLIVEKQTNKSGAPTGKANITAVKADPDGKPVSIIATIDGKEYTCEVNIKAPVIAKQNIKVKAGKSTTVSLKNTKLKKADIEWMSEDDKIASVAAGGKVTGISEGTVIIYTITGGVRNECLVTVY